MRATGLALLLLAGCTYDLVALRHDAGAPRVDVVSDRGPADDGVVDAPALNDAGTTRAGACDVPGGAAAVQSFLGVGNDAGALAYGFATGTLSGAPGIALPTGSVNGCTIVDPVTTPPTRVYRYQVVAGGRVTASTNDQFCTGFHSRVYGLWSCSTPDFARPVGCADGVDDGSATTLCPACGDAGADQGACGRNLAALSLDTTPPLAAGDVVYFAVTGANLPSTGLAHRLWVGENAAQLAAPPPSGALRVANHCTCQNGTGTAHTVLFPIFARGENFPPPNPGESFIASRDLPEIPYGGVAMQLRIVSRSTPTSSTCGANPTATFDLSVGNVLLTSFTIGADFPVPGIVTVPYTAFAPITPTRANGGMGIQLTVRNIQPSPECLVLAFDPSPGGSQLTLFEPP